MADLAQKMFPSFFGFFAIFFATVFRRKIPNLKKMKILEKRFFSKWRKLVRNDQKQWNMVYKRILKVLFAQIHHMGHFWAEIRTLKFFTRNYECEKSSKIKKNWRHFWGAKSAIFDDTNVKKSAKDDFWVF